MIDVHVPEKSEHTWTDFFIHIGTIAVGLLLAIGLEQGVEYIHHHQERTELREALEGESVQIVQDSRIYREKDDALRLWTSVRIAQLTTALRDNRPVPAAPPVSRVSADIPDDPIWQAAKTSSSAALLSRDELTGYGELNEACANSKNFNRDIGLAARAGSAYALRFGGTMSTADLSHDSREEIQEMIERLGTVDQALQADAGQQSEIEGAAEAIHNGERDITKIYAAEKSARKREDDAFAPRLASALALASSSSRASGE